VEGEEKLQVVWWLLLVWCGKWAVRLLERDVATGMFRRRNSTGIGVVIFVWNGKWAVRLLERDVATGGGGEKQYR